jgi:hypothetical protein
MHGKTFLARCSVTEDPPTEDFHGSYPVDVRVPNVDGTPKLAAAQSLFPSSLTPCNILHLGPNMW